MRDRESQIRGPDTVNRNNVRCFKECTDSSAFSTENCGFYLVSKAWLE